MSTLQTSLCEQSLLCQSRNPGVGHFIAYCNGSIKIIFDDYSILRMNKKDSFCTILTRQGDQLKVQTTKPSGFYKHVASAVQFIAYAFSSEQQRIDRAIQKENQQRMVQYQIDKIQRHLDILRIGSVPLSQGKSKPWMKIECQSQDQLSPQTDLLQSSSFFTPNRFDNANLTGTSENKRYRSAKLDLQSSAAYSKYNLNDGEYDDGDDGDDDEISIEQTISQADQQEDQETKQKQFSNTSSKDQAYDETINYQNKQIDHLNEQDEIDKLNSDIA